MRTLPIVIGILAFAPRSSVADVNIVVDPRGHQQITIHIEAADAGARDHEAPPAVSTPAPVKPRTGLSLLVGASMLRQDSYEELIPVLTARVAYPLTASVTAAGTVGIGEYDTYMTNTLVPVRLGLEGRAGAVGLELGVQHMMYQEEVCGSRGTNTGAYGVGRVYVPLGATLSFVGELGGSYVMSSSPSTCDSSPSYFSYGGWAGAGLQWTR